MFDRLCAWLASHLGHSGVFVGCFVIVLAALGLAIFVTPWRDGINLWAGAISGYVSILLLVVLQNSQNRGDVATHLKLDALISVNRDLSNRLISIEQRPVQEIVEEAERMRVELRED
jgi:low affinity Fe/Cu permease